MTRAIISLYSQALTLTCALLLSTSANALAQTPEQTVKAPEIMEHEGRRFTAYIDEKTGTPSWIIDVDALDFNLGVERSLGSEASVADAAYAFLAAYADVFGIQPEQLILERLTTNGDLWFIGYRQAYQGLPVLNAEVGLTVMRSGRLVAAGVKAFPDLDVDVTPRFNASAAIQSARSHAGVLNAKAVGEQELIIVPEELEDRYVFKLAWQIRLDDFEQDIPFSKTFLVDAHTGNLIAAYNNILESSAHRYHRPPSSTTDTPTRLPAEAAASIPYALPPENLPKSLFEAVGLAATNSVWGYVKLNYYETPDDYTDPLIRHTDQAFFDAKVTVENDATHATSTTYANASGYYSVSGLSAGSHTVTFEIANQKAYIDSGLSASEQEKSFTVSVSGATQRDYDWDWGDSGDGGITSYALNGVFQVREMYDYIKDTYSYSGMDGVTHPLTISSSGTGSTTGVAISLGGTEAMSSEVTLHEYTHDVIYKIYGNKFINTGQSGQTYDESYAMDEGFADYFAADKTNDYTYGGPEADADPNAPSGDGVGIRFLYNTCTMDDFDSGWPCGSEQHNRGRIIGGAVWRIRIAIGTEASEILFDALQISPLPHTFEDLRARYVAADVARNSGANAAVIEQKFVERKIGGPVAPGLPSITITGPGFPQIAWDDNSVTEDGYLIERKFNAGSWSVLDDLSPNTEQYTDYDYKCLGGGSGTYSYRIQGYNDGGETYSATTTLLLSTCEELERVVQAPPPVEVQALEQVNLGGRTALEAAHPNPFNPTTTLRYVLAEAGAVRMAVYDVLGREVAVLVDDTKAAGMYEVDFEASHLPSGLYIVRLKTADRQFSRTVLLAK